MARFQKYRLSWPVTSSQWYNVDAMFSEIYADIAAGQSIPNTAVVPGTYGSATQIPVFTVNETGNLTFASSVAIPVTAAAAGTLTGTTLAPNVIFSSLTTVGTLVGGATGPGFTINVGPGESPIVGLIPTANLGLRTATNNTFLRGDQVWASTTEAIPAIVDVQSTNNGMATGTYSVGPFLTNPNVGDTIVVCTWVQGSPVSAVAPTDTLGNTYTQIGTNATSPGDGFGFPVTWAAVSIATGSCTISSVNTNRAMAIAWLISGAGVYNGDYQSALSTGGVAAIASGPSSPAPAPGSIFLSFTSQDTSPTGVFTYGLGWNTTGVNGFTSAMIASGRNWIEESSVGGIHVDSEYSISSAVRNGTYTSPSAGSWGAVVFSFAPGTRPVVATVSAITNDNSTNAAMYPVWVSATPGNEQLKTSSTELVWNPGICAGGAFGIGGVTVDGQWRVVIAAKEASGISALQLRANLGANAGVFDTRVFAISNELNTKQLFQLVHALDGVQLAANASTIPLNLDLRTIGAASLMLGTTNIIRWTLYPLGGFSNTAVDPGASVLAQGGALALGTVSTDGIVTENDTASTALIPVQKSPRIRFRSHVWNTTTPADNTNDWWFESVPVSGATPSGALVFNSSINGGASTQPFTFLSGGNFNAPVGTITAQNLAAQAGGLIFWTSRFVFNSPATGQMVWNNGAQNAGIGFDVTTDSTVKIRTRAQTGDGSLTALNITTSGTLIDKSYNIATPATLATVTMSANQQRQVINPAGTIAVLTVTLPPTPTDGQIAGISFTQIVSALTVNAPAGATVVQAPTSAAVDTNFRFIYQASSTSWFPAA